MAATAFGDELELELRYIDPTVGELFNPATAKTLQDFEAQRSQSLAGLGVARLTDYNEPVLVGQPTNEQDQQAVAVVGRGHELDSRWLARSRHRITRQRLGNNDSC